MLSRYRPVLGVIAAMAALAPAGAAVGAQSAARSATTAAGKSSAVPRTADGRPDLNGIWTFATLTPIERPQDLGGKEVLTDQEAAGLEERAARNRVDRPPRAGDTGAYNLFWIEQGTKVVGTKRTSLVVDPPDGRIPALTADAQQRQAARIEAGRRPAAGPEDRSLAERCIIGFNSGPPMTPGGYNQNVHVFQNRDSLVLLNEMVHNARIVPLDGRPHGSVRQWAGDSRGRWEGDTLVVETVNFSDKFNFRGAGPSMKLTERFSRPDADTLLYEFTITDQTVWTKPWTVQLPMTKNQGGMFEYACHEGNHGMFGILSGARADDVAAQAKRD